MLRLMIACALALHLSSAALAEELDRPVVVDAVEGSFSGVFLFTTNGNGRYAIYQRIDSRSEVPEGANVVCMFQDCYLRIADAEEPALRDDGRLGPVRAHFKAVRDTYDAMRRAGAVDKAAAESLWREEIAHLGPCIAGSGQC
jgi:hypothetical protein